MLSWLLEVYDCCLLFRFMWCFAQSGWDSVWGGFRNRRLYNDLVLSTGKVSQLHSTQYCEINVQRLDKRIWKDLLSLICRVNCNELLIDKHTNSAYQQTNFCMQKLSVLPLVPINLCTVSYQRKSTLAFNILKSCI